eukprot:4650849-Lingulodinium_polyedra.AAC.1
MPERCRETVFRLSNQMARRGGQTLRVGLPAYNAPPAKNVDTAIARGGAPRTTGGNCGSWPTFRAGRGR